MVIGKLPPVWINFSEAIGVKLSDKAGEVVVLEVARQQLTGELCCLPDNETEPIWSPRDYVVI